MDISYVENDAIKKLKEVTQELAISQRKAIESGAMSSKEIAETNILAEVEEVDVYDVEEIEE
jgi:ribosomal protein L4